MLIARTLPELRSHVLALRAGGRRLALVPTMGALHAGHLALVAAGRAVAEAVAVSIFVNPLQFAPTEDLSRYPRTEEADLGALRGVGADLVWLPPVAAMYPPGSATTIQVEGPSAGFEGAVRPGHFRGVATVCAKLFLQSGADVAVFGEKDFQQLQVVRRMAADLDIPIEILGVPTVREADGLAMSSRNRFLSAAERALAPRFHAVLTATADALAEGQPAAEALAAGEAALRQAGLAPDYLALVAPETLLPLAALPPGGVGRILAAARLGAVRLLDNVAVQRG